MLYDIDSEGKRREVNQPAWDLLSLQVQHLFCFRQRSLSPPQRGGGLKGGMK